MAITASPSVALAAPGKGKAGTDAKMDKTLQSRGNRPGWSRVIVTLRPGIDVTTEIKRLGGRFGRQLSLINGQVIELPNGQLKKLAEHPAVLRLDHDRPTMGSMARVSQTVGADAVESRYGYDGAGVGVAVIDSGIANWHDDLTYRGSSTAVLVKDGQRVAAFVDFVNGESHPYDDNGHGTHVAGIIAGNGYDSYGQREGIAPAAHLVSLKVLDREGRGVISDVIAALGFAVQNRAAFNIRVINLSVGSRVTSSYNEDPLTLAAKAAVDAGIVVVTAAGNVGQQNGQSVYGGILSPANAPWVLTVGASDHQGTATRRDDTVAPYSSKGPTPIDYAAKPDLVAPGTGIVSLSAPGSLLYSVKSASLVRGVFSFFTRPYMSLSGTSMAAPVVTGSVALMIQANPNLTPNLVKAILQYTAQRQQNIDALSQGAGFLNTYGAVELARYYQTAQLGDRFPHDRNWSRTIHWGNRLLKGGAISPIANAWELGTVWGSARDREGDNIVWGTVCGDACRNIVWGTLTEGDNIVWGTLRDEGDNIVWGTLRDEGDNIVWGTLGDDLFNIVWGTLCGGDDCFNIVWGTVAAEGDNIVWGTLFAEGDNIVWGTLFGEGDNIVWGTVFGEGDNIVWGTSGDDTLEYADDTIEEVIDFLLLFEEPPPPTTSTTTTSGGELLGGVLGGGL